MDKVTPLPMFNVPLESAYSEATDRQILTPHNSPVPQASVAHLLVCNHETLGWARSLPSSSRASSVRRQERTHRLADGWPARRRAVFAGYLAAPVVGISNLSCVFVSKSLASWRSNNWLEGSPQARLTLRPRCTAGRRAISSVQRSTFLYS